MIGNEYLVSGMRIKIISDEGDKWQTRNLTTNDTVWFDKFVLDQAIRLGKAEALDENHNQAEK